MAHRLLAAALLTLAAVLPAAASAAPVPFGDPVDVAPPAEQAKAQYWPDVAMAADGSFAVVYNEYDGVSSDNDRVWVQRFAANVTKVGPRILVGPSDRRGLSASITMAADGRFAVAASINHDNFYSHTEVQRFKADGTPDGPALLPDGTTKSYESEPPGLAMADDGRLAVAWVTSAGLRVRSYDGAGAPLTDAATVESGVTNFAHPSIGMAADGRFVLTWARSTVYGNDGVIPGQRYHADGTADGAQLTLFHGALNRNYTLPAVGMDDSGRFFLAFVGPQPTSSTDTDVFGRRFDAAGAPLGDVFGVSTYTTYNQTYPDVALDTDGDVLLAFEGQVSTQQWSYLRQFSAAGAPVADEQHIGSSGSGELHRADVATDGSARSAFVWTQAASPASNVYVQRWNYAPVSDPPPPDPTPTATTTTTTTTAATSDPVPVVATATPVVATATSGPTPVASTALVVVPKIAESVTFPSTKRCASRRAFPIRLRVPRGASVVQATVKVNGKQVAVRKGDRLRSTVNLKSLPKGRFSVTIALKLTDGRTVSGTRNYRTCAKKQAGGKVKV